MISFLLSHRAAVIFCLLLLTAMLGWFAANLTVDPGAEAILPSSGKELRDLREFNSTFGSDEVIVVALHSPSLFTAEGLETIRRLTDAAGRLDDVTRVLSPTNARDVDGDEMGPFPLVPYEKVASGEWRAEELGRHLASHPIFGGLLVSEDLRTAAILIEVKRIEGDSGYRSRLVERLRSLARRAAGGIEVYVAGIPVEKSDVGEYVKRDQRLFVPLIFGLLGLVTLLLYRHPVGVAIPLCVVAVSLLWTLGLYGAAGRSLNPVTSLMTPVILVVSVAESIHLLNHYLAARAAGLAKRAALEQAIQRARLPCFNAALTTAIGFGSLLVLPIPAIRDFGLFTAAGVMLSYLLTMLLAPLLIASLPDFPPRVTQAFRGARVESALRRIVATVCEHPVIAALAVLAALGVSLAGVARIRVETDLIRSLRADAPLSLATRFIDEHLTGVNSLEVVVREVSVTDPESLARVARFEAKLRDLPGIRKVTGFPDLAARVNRALHAGDEAFDRLPEGEDATADLSDIRELLAEEAPHDLARFIAPDGRSLRLAARVNALDSGSSQRLFKRIRAAASEAGLQSVTLTGNFAVLSNLSTTLVSNQLRGLVPAMVLIFGAMAAQFRSLRLGLVSILPSGAPVLMAYGMMGLSGIPLSVPTAMIASIAIGMTVDNTIHLLARFREEFARDGDYPTALKAMMDTSGRAVLYSTLIVAAGFLVGAFSSFRPSVHFAVLTGTTLLLGLACEAVLLPLSLILFKPLGRPSKAASGAGKRAALALAAMLSLMGPLAPRPIEAAGDLLLKDQFGHLDGPSRHRGAPLLLLYGQPPELRRMKAWEVKTLEKAEGDLAVLRAVDARMVKGKKTEAEVSARLQRSVPKEISILVDWEGDLARAYSLPPTGVSATVLDSQGKACHTASGPVKDATLQELLKTLARVREKGACP